jgi:hypothetical protein
MIQILIYNLKKILFSNNNNLEQKIMYYGWRKNSILNLIY